MSISNLRRGIEVILIRHGESESNQHIHIHKHDVSQEILNQYQNAELTDLGKIQAIETSKNLCENLKKEDILHIFISPQGRAIDTSKPFLKSLCDNKSKITIEDTIYEHRPSDRKRNLCIHVEYEYGFGDARDVILSTETFDEFVNRVRKFKDILENLEKKWNSDNIGYVVVYGHSLFFSTLILLCSTNSCTNICSHADQLPFHLQNCSKSILRYNGKMWSVLYVNRVDHLTNPTGGHTHI